MYLEPLDHVPKFFRCRDFEIQTESNNGAKCHYFGQRIDGEYSCVIVGLEEHPLYYEFGSHVKWLCTKENRTIEGWSLRYVVDSEYYMYRRLASE